MLLFTMLLAGFGVFLIISAYFLLLSGSLSKRSSGFAILNLIGGLVIIFPTVYDTNWPGMVAAIMWCVVSLYGMTTAANSSSAHQASNN